MLYAGPAIELQVLLDLRFLFALSRLVDRKLHAMARISHHLRAQRGVLGRNIFVVERDELRKAEDAPVKISPGVHLAPPDVADAVIDVLQSRFNGVFEHLARLDETGCED